MHVYICLYRNQRLLVTAASSYEAQRTAARQLRVKRAWDVSVHLADQPVHAGQLPGA